MAFSAARITQLAIEFGFDSGDTNFIHFTIDNPTDSDIENAIVKPEFPHSLKELAHRFPTKYESVVFYEDSAGEITLSSACTEVTE